MRLLFKPETVAPPRPDTTAQGTTGVTDTTATSGTAVTVATKDGKGAVLLTAFPYLRLDEVRNLSTNKAISLTDLGLGDDLSDPLRLDLAPGKYAILFSSASGAKDRRDVTVEAGMTQPLHIPGKGVNIDEVVEDILSQ